MCDCRILSAIPAITHRPPPEHRHDVDVGQNLRGIRRVRNAVYQNVETFVKEFGMVPFAAIDEQRLAHDCLRELEHVTARAIV